MKRLSIIVPMYNSAQFLPKCLDSLVNQDIPSDCYEIILVNDGSPDQSLQLADQYAGRYSNIVVLSQENKGTSGARNTGIRYASGEYLYFVDPDDYILENSLSEILQIVENKSLDVLRFRYAEVDENYAPTRSCKHPEQPDYSSSIMDGYSFMAERLGTACYVWTYLFRTSLIKSNGIYFIEGDYFDDTPWLPRVLAKAQRVDSVDYVRHFYLIRSDSLVQSKSTDAIKKKVNGQLFLIDELKRQKDGTINGKGIQWYEMMVASCVLSLLSLIGTYDFLNRKDYIKRLKEQDVFPLSRYRKTGISHLKVLLINISPNLFCLLIHLNNLK